MEPTPVPTPTPEPSPETVVPATLSERVNTLIYCSFINFCIVFLNQEIIYETPNKLLNIVLCFSLILPFHNY